MDEVEKAEYEAEKTDPDYEVGEGGELVDFGAHGSAVRVREDVAVIHLSCAADHASCLPQKYVAPVQSLGERSGLEFPHIAALRARMRGEPSRDGGTEGRSDGHDGCEWEAIFGGRQTQKDFAVSQGHTYIAIRTFDHTHVSVTCFTVQLLRVGLSCRYPAHLWDCELGAS